MSVADLTIERIAAGGDGIAREGGVVVFVPRTAPGDRARVRLDVRKRFARGAVEELLVPSPERVDPPCLHYRIDKCGGCQLQHMRYDAQLEAKRSIVRDALARIGKRPVELPDIEASELQWRYRRKLTLAMRRKPTGDWIIGLHPYDDAGGVFQLADCPITVEGVVTVWHEIMEASAYFPPTDELRTSVRLVDDGASIVVEGGTTWRARHEFFDAVPAATALWWKPAHRPRSLVAERGGQARQAAVPPVGMRTAANASFIQVNAAVADSLRAYVTARAQAHRPRTVVDAYAGSGDTAIPLARSGARVVAVESDSDAVERCAAQLPTGSRAVVARVEDVLATLLPSDVLLMNPPRAGVHERVAAILQEVAVPPRALIYVSCDPATLGRDLARMPRYAIRSLRSFDMFPQTAHVETVCELVPEPAA